MDGGSILHLGAREKLLTRLSCSKKTGKSSAFLGLCEVVSHLFLFFQCFRCLFNLWKAVENFGKAKSKVLLTCITTG